MNLYTVALLATKDDQAFVVPACAMAEDKNEAQRAGMARALEHFPAAEGFAGHLAIVGIIADNFLIEAGWVRRNKTKRAHNARDEYKGPPKSQDFRKTRKGNRNNGKERKAD